MIASRIAHAAPFALASTSRSVLLRRSAPAICSLVSRSTATPLAPQPRTFSTTRRALANNDFDSSNDKQASSSGPEREMTSGEQDIHALLTKRFKPAHLQVQDVSGGCGSFYAIVVASKEFAGLNTVKQHRMVNECLKDIIGGIHGLQLKTIPAE